MKFLILIVFLLQCNITHAQQIFIPYQSQNKWGLADTSGKVVLTPEYDAIQYEEFSNYSLKGMYFIATKNKKKGVLLNNKLIIPAKFDYVGISQTIIFCNSNLQNNKRSTFLYNSFGKQLNAEAFTEIEQTYHNENNDIFPTYIIKNPSGSFSLTYIDSAKGLVFLVKNAYGLTKLGEYFSIQQTKKDKVVNALIVKNIKEGIKLKNIDLNSDEAYPQDHTQVSVAPEMYRAEKYAEYSFIKENNIWKTINLRSYVKNDKPFDFTKYDSVYDLGMSSFSLIYEDQNGITKSYQNLLLSKTAKGYGMLFPDGKSISNNYDTIETVKLNMGTNILQYFTGIIFKVKKDGRYALINQNEKIIIPFEYNSINKDMVVTKGNKYGIVNTNNSTILPIEYDSIHYDYNHNFYTLQKSKKFGLLFFNPDGKTIGDFIKLDCISPNPLSGVKIFRIIYPVHVPYIVYECKDAIGNLIGYYDRKGFPYFR